MKKKVLLALTTIVIISLWSTTAVYAQAAGNENTSIIAGANAATVQQGKQIALLISIENVTGLYSVQVRVTWDPAILEIVDADPDQDGIQVATGEFFSDDALTIINSADNISGTLDFGVTLSGDASSLNGDGILAQVTFYARQDGFTPLNLSYVRLYDSEARSIEATIQVGEITVNSQRQVGGKASGYQVFLPAIFNNAGN